MQRYFSSLVEKMTLSEDDLHHIKNVMRGKISDRFELVFDSKIHLCEITSCLLGRQTVVKLRPSTPELLGLPG